jgi:hypothetical protein
MPSREKPQDAHEAPGTPPRRRPGLLRTELPPACGVGALMGVVAAREGSGVGVAVVVSFVGCAVVLGMLALKRAVSGR